MWCLDVWTAPYVFFPTTLAFGSPFLLSLSAQVCNVGITLFRPPCPPAPDYCCCCCWRRRIPDPPLRPTTNERNGRTGGRAGRARAHHPRPTTNERNGRTDGRAGWTGDEREERRTDGWPGRARARRPRRVHCTSPSPPKHQPQSPGLGMESSCHSQGPWPQARPPRWLWPWPTADSGHDYGHCHDHGQLELQCGISR